MRSGSPPGQRDCSAPCCHKRTSSLTFTRGRERGKRAWPESARRPLSCWATSRCAATRWSRCPTPASAADAKRLPPCASRPVAVRSFCSGLRADLADDHSHATRCGSCRGAAHDGRSRDEGSQDPPIWGAQASARGRGPARPEAGGRPAICADDRREDRLGDHGATCGRSAERPAGRDSGRGGAPQARESRRQSGDPEAHAPSALTPAPYDLLAHLR